MKIAIRQAAMLDLDSILDVQSRCYQNVPLECREVLWEKMWLSPDGCYVAEMDSACVGYVLAHPWMFLDPPGINSQLKTIPENADCFYIHDLAVSEEGRGQGLGGRLLELTIKWKASGLEGRSKPITVKRLYTLRQ